MDTKDTPGDAAEIAYLRAELQQIARLGGRAGEMAALALSNARPAAAPTFTSEQIDALILEHSEPSEDGSYCINRGDMRAFAADVLNLVDRLASDTQNRAP